ncbi:signal-regulatory protein beta-2-like isoform X1 [Amphiprion ocellaris]|uniref:Ig-like domain-containing protein n=1 Tax=Amphiprion ocellaris TaxID=80972 RepID=A0AAQ5X1M4_AMPOC|nr:signal-regulatory protein beta-2-like isoform X1 [Amphiprion ocellaris]
MLVLFYFLLMLRVGCCTDDHNFVTQTVGVGQSVTLTCTRQTYLYQQPTLHWIRLVSGKSPELLGGTNTFDYDGIYETPHITAKQGPGTFILQIHETQLNDSGFYYCIKVNQLNMEFMNTTFLRIKGPEPDVIDIIQVPPSDPEHPGDSVSLQCSVLSDSEKKTCPEQQHRMFWFRAGSDESHPRLIYADGNSQDECETKPEAQSLQKCIYSFSKTVTSSDAGTYYCAVATCGQILFGNGVKSDNKALNMRDLKTDNTALFLVSAALAASLIVIAFLIYTIKMKTFCNGNTIFPHINVSESILLKLALSFALFNCVIEPTPSFTLNLCKQMLQQPVVIRKDHRMIQTHGFILLLPLPW